MDLSSDVFRVFQIDRQVVHQLRDLLLYRIFLRGLELRVHLALLLLDFVPAFEGVLFEVCDAEKYRESYFRELLSAFGYFSVVLALDLLFVAELL